jgi:NTE family protein
MRVFFVILLLICVSGCSSKKRQRLYVPLHTNSAHYDPSILKNQDINVVLVLSGGGARAIAHFGVLEVLEENDIPIDLIIGTSGGSIIGALYADNPSMKSLSNVIKKGGVKDFLVFSLLSGINGMSNINTSFVDGSKGEKFLLENMHAKNFEDLKIPFIAVATDIINGKTVPLNKGKVAPAVRASYSMPGLLPPVKINDMILVDGGVTAPLGMEIAKQSKAKLIIAVDVVLPDQEKTFTNSLGILYKSFTLTYKSLSDALAQEADIRISPQVESVGLFDSSQKEQIIESGRRAALEQLPEIKKQLSKKMNPLKRIFNTN